MNTQSLVNQCTRCGKGVARDELLVKRAVFMTPGEGAKTIRARVVARLCPACTAVDAEWNLPARRIIEVNNNATQ